MNDIRALEEETKAELDRVSFHEFNKLLCFFLRYFSTWSKALKL